MGKRKTNRRTGKRAYLKRYSAAALVGGQKVNFGAYYELHRSHIESLGVPDYGQSWSLKSWKDRLRKNYDEDGKEIKPTTIRDHDPIVKNRPQAFHPIPETIYSLEQLIDNKFQIPKLEVNKLRKRYVNGHMEPRWHRVVFHEDEFCCEAVYFYADKAFWMDLDKRTNMCRTSRVFPSLARAKQAKSLNQVGWEPFTKFKLAGG
jgi:hypothetical protein